MTKTTQHKMTANDIEEILDLAAELASRDEDEDINSDMLGTNPYTLPSYALNHSEKHYIQKALDQLQTQGKIMVDTATTVL